MTIEKLKQTIIDNRLSLDQAQDYIYQIISLNAFTNEQVAALFMSVFMQMLDKPHNAHLLKQLGVDSIDIDSATTLINLWTKTYAKKLNDT